MMIEERSAKFKKFLNSCVPNDPWLWVSLLVAAVFLFFRLETIPGLHADEAWVGLGAQEILEGKRPILGMQSYTGALHLYLVAPLFKWFGSSVWLLRLPGVIFNLVALVFVYRVTEKYFEKRTAQFSALILATMPFFIEFSRISHDLIILNPFFMFLGLYCFLRGQERNSAKYFIALGVLCALGVWNHAIFIAFPLALLLTAGVLSIGDWGALIWTGVGLFLGYFPNLVFRIQNPSYIHTPLSDFISGVVQRLRDWPAILLEFAHGDLLARRFTGTVFLEFSNITGWMICFSFFSILAIAITQKLLGIKVKREKDIPFLVFGIWLFLMTLLISPANSDRYFLLILFLIPVLLARVFSKLQAFQFLKFKIPYLVSGFALIQIARVCVNFFYVEASGAAYGTIFMLGSQAETSNHFLKTDKIYERLRALGAKKVCSEFFIAEPLKFYSIQDHKSIQFEGAVEPCLDSSLKSEKNVYGVIYREGNQFVRADQFKGFVELERDADFIILKPVESGAHSGLTTGTH